MLRSIEVNDIGELKREGMSIRAISELTGFDRKTVRKYLLEPAEIPKYPPRVARPGKLDDYKPYLEQRLQAGVWNACVLLREIRQRGYTGGYSILTDWLRPRRELARVVAVRRFETPPGKQAQVDWGYLGRLVNDGGAHRLWGFTFTLGYSRAMMAEAALNQKLATLLRMHEEAFRQLGGVPEEILYDWMKTVCLGADERGEPVWHSVFLDFARYWGFTPRLCRPRRPQTKGKVESGVKYVRRNFICGLLGREPGGLDDCNAQLRAWVWSVANQRQHGTTGEKVDVRWEAERLALQSLTGQLPYPYAEDELRKVARDAYVSWQGSRYSVPWRYAGESVWVRGDGLEVEVRYGPEKIAIHQKALHRHAVITRPEHHDGIPLGEAPHGKTQVEIHESAPMVEVRPLAAYESAAAGGGS